MEIGQVKQAAGVQPVRRCSPVPKGRRAFAMKRHMYIRKTRYFKFVALGSAMSKQQTLANQAQTTSSTNKSGGRRSVAEAVASGSQGKAADAGSASPDLVEAGSGGHRSAAEEAASDSRGRGCGGGEGVGNRIRGGVGGREAREGAGGQTRLPGGQTWRCRRPGGEGRRRRPDLASWRSDLAIGSQEVATASVLKAGGREATASAAGRREKAPAARSGDRRSGGGGSVDVEGRRARPPGDQRRAKEAATPSS
uniref:Uncharacterized protein n=1 Tax=Oryza meridionalis TaxID=40149 RepID=A0A0E0CS06_9ORYZ